MRIPNRRYVCAYRIEGMFVHQFKFAVREDLTVALFHSDMKIGQSIGDYFIKNISFEEHLQNFCDHMERYEIKGYILDIEKSLELNDCWGDDPIGSGGLKVVDIDRLPPNDVRELKAVFHPFYRVVEQADIYAVYNRKDIKSIQKHYGSNNLFKIELKKRKQRSLAIGQDPLLMQYNEIVWLDLTFRFKDWALSKGYDAFSYINTAEGEGESCYVTLKPGHASEQINVSYKFDREKYLVDARKLMPTYIFDTSIKKPKDQEGFDIKGLWFGQIPMKYFSKA